MSLGAGIIQLDTRRRVILGCACPETLLRVTGRSAPIIRTKTCYADFGRVRNSGRWRSPCDARKRRKAPWPRGSVAITSKQAQLSHLLGTTCSLALSTGHHEVGDTSIKRQQFATAALVLPTQWNPSGGVLTLEVAAIASSSTSHALLLCQ